MKNLKYFAQRYIDWVIRLGRVRFSLLGIVIVAVLALSVQILLSLAISNTVHWQDILRSIVFGLFTAPFVIYFFTLLVERLERSRQALSNSVVSLRKEVADRICAEQKLSEALARLAKNNRDKTTLMATISHELRTPLNGIIGLSRILLDEPLTPQQRDYLQTINVSASSLGYIFSDIIDLDKIDSKRIELHPQPTDFPALLNDVYHIAHLMARQKGLAFHLHCPENLPQWLMLDRTRVCQVLWNLISNAVKFTEQGEIILTLEKQGENAYVFQLADTGSGIADEELKNIFTMYYQSQDSQHRAAGSGIGLAISKNLAKLMQGDLTVKSRLGEGSTFSFSFLAESTTAPQQAEAQTISGLRVLLVEDVELNVIVAQKTLEKLGQQVEIARNGAEAIRLFEQKSYDLILLDIKLPDMSGFEIAQYLRERYEMGVYDYLPPLIAFTANVMQSERDYQIQGMDAVLRKPLDVAELKQCFSRFFDDVEFSSVESDANVASHELNRQLIDLLGKTQMEQNLRLFQQQMPLYLEELQQAYRDYLQTGHNAQEVADIAHKIKGACASMGCLLLQQTAQKLQQIDESWALMLEDRIHWLQAQYPLQIQQLQDYLRTS
ncbi:ATP-binding protein [uncultured Haemophilus sp.]|uniref:ATP-binding protein n=1 Tax=uncultured Haemophilus sp. TaxID=237779 RepID=UPI0028045E4C|nr:ATP-binding protein [uncultured Haemophilus sp.]